VLRLYKDLGIASFDELESAAQDDRVKEAKGLGAALQTKILQNLAIAEKAYRNWLAISKITEGPILREITRHGRMRDTALTGAAIALIVKRVVKTAGIAEGLTEIDAQTRANAFASHSLRSGLATSAAENDARWPCHPTPASPQVLSNHDRLAGRSDGRYLSGLFQAQAPHAQSREAPP
jgi:hypothetical protein